MSRQQLTYECPDCGESYIYDREEVKDNSLKNRIWGDRLHVWPVWAICSNCFEQGTGQQKMWPQIKGPKREMTCNLCDFQVDYPEALLHGEDDGFNCPHCGGIVS